MKYKLITSETLPGRVKVPEKSHAVEKIRLTFLSFLVFAVGIPSTQTLNLVGELYVTELLLPLLAVGVLIFGRSQVLREKIFWQFVIACFVMMLGYIISDLVAGTDSSRYLRAWGRNLLLFTDLIALAIIVGSDKRLIWWFVLGMATGSLFFLALDGVTFSDQWKIGYGQPLILMMILLSYFLPFRVTIVGLIVFAVISIYMDSRTLSAFCLIVAGITYIRIKKPGGFKLNFLVLFKILTVAIVLITLLNVLMSQTQDEFSNRRESSSTGRFAALGVGLVAISDSPVLGHGSWGEGTEKYADMIYKDLLPVMKELGRAKQWEKSDIFRPHSQLLQSWVEGGILAAIFFLFLGYQIIVGLKQIILTRQLDYLTPLYSFLLILSLWHLIMSPYSGSHRMQIALAIAVLCSLRLGRKD